jgi:NADH-quinone oxidoreductase subunit C
MIESLKQHYNIEQKDIRLFKIVIQKEKFLKTLSFISSNSNFITLSQITCTDWIEDKLFTLNYILTNRERNKNLMIELQIPREQSKISTLLNFFPQAKVMERDLHEMYGIEFIGNPTLYDFALENWKEIPPLRREFDTLAYVNEQFEFRRGREDNRDVKVEMKKRRAEAKRLKNAKK